MGVRYLLTLDVLIVGMGTRPTRTTGPRRNDSVGPGSGGDSIPMGTRGLEPPPPCEDWLLKPARIPIPPHARGAIIRDSRNLVKSGYFRCAETNLVISNMLTSPLPPKIGFNLSSAMILRLLVGF